jgi:hypothetical protein
MARPRLTEREFRALGTGITLPAQPRPGRRSLQGRVLAGIERTPAPTRVLGLDLAIGTTGWCLLVAGQPVAHGSFTLPDRAKNETLAHWLGRRAEHLARQVSVLLYDHQPELVGYEFPDSPRPEWSGGTKGREFHAVQGLSRAEGFLVALWPVIGANLRLVAVPASLVRRTAAGRVNANKGQVRYGLMTYRQWDLSGWSDNEVDASAVALAARETM